MPGSHHEYLRRRIEKVEVEHSWKHSAIYAYFDAEGRLSYTKVRFIDKQNERIFRQHALSSNGDWEVRNEVGTRRILYRLNTLAAPEEVFIVNGEKAADRGAFDLDIVTTCSPDTEGNWCVDSFRAALFVACYVWNTVVLADSGVIQQRSRLFLNKTCDRIEFVVPNDNAGLHRRVFRSQSVKFFVTFFGA